MDASQNYNGWSNYPTWAVNLWLSNDEGLYNEALALVAEITSATESTSEVWTLAESHRFNLADSFRDWVGELSADGFASLGDPRAEPSMRDDLFGWALDQVDWQEIADAWISDSVAVL